MAREGGDAVTADGGEVLQGFQVVGGSCPNLGIAVRWGAATFTVQIARGRVSKVFLYLPKRFRFDTIK